MKRRDFIALLGGATSWPFTAMAQQPAMPVVGFLTSRTAQQAEYLLPSFRAGLKESGYAEGQNVAAASRHGGLPARPAHNPAPPAGGLARGGVAPARSR